ncbi:MAG: ferredoxin--NADP reductase [Candidatus Dormibacteria bacterium]
MAGTVVLGTGLTLRQWVWVGASLLALTFCLGLVLPAAILIFSARTEADVIYRSRLLEWQEEHTNFRFIRTLTREPGAPPLGRVPTLLPRLVDSLAKRSVFAAGPQGFVDACAAVAHELGVQSRRLHTEAFFLDPQPWGGGLD